MTNRQDGFAISGSILAKSKFYGNSVSAIMDGVGRMSFLKRGEDYTITMPYAHCKGKMPTCAISDNEIKGSMKHTVSTACILTVL